MHIKIENQALNSFFMLRMDRCECEANIDATIRTLALSILSLVYCGESELKPPSDLEIQFSLPDFSIPQPSNRGELRFSKLSFVN